MTHRTTISIPADLKEAMDAIGDRVNWSRVAAAAFRAKVLEIKARERRGARMKKSDVVKRLKAAREVDTSDYDDGFRAGREWAQQQATPKELRRLCAYLAEHDRANTDWWDVDYPGWSAPWGAVDNLTFAIRPKLKEELDEQGIRSFWENVLGDEDHPRIQDADFLRGFGEGAAEVWSEVSGEL